LTQAQVDAACGEATSLGKRAIVHAQGPEGARAAVLAGCTSVEHGYRLTDEVLDLMAQHGTYYDPNFGLLLHNYIENKEKFLGIGNFNEEGFEYMQKGIPIGIDTFKRAMNRKIKMVFGTDVGAGGLGRNFEEFIYRIRDGGQPPMEAIISATSRAAESIRMQDKIGTLAPVWKPTSCVWIPRSRSCRNDCFHRWLTAVPDPIDELLKVSSEASCSDVGTENLLILRFIAR